MYGGRVFVGSAGKQFCSLFLESGRKKRDAWCFQVGAAIVGRAAADATHVLLRRVRQPAARARSEERRLPMEEGSALPAVGWSAARRDEHRGSRERAARRRVRDEQGGVDDSADAGNETGDRAAPDRCVRRRTGPHRGGDGRIGERLERHARGARGARPAIAADRAAHGAARAGDSDWQAANSSRIAAASRRTPSSIRSGVGAENDSRMK